MTWWRDDRDVGDADFYGKTKVVGWETITTPLGTVKALRVETSGTYSKPPNFVPASFKITERLLPEAKMKVILKSQEHWWSSGSQEWHEAMILFELAK